MKSGDVANNKSPVVVTDPVRTTESSRSSNRSAEVGGALPKGRRGLALPLPAVASIPAGTLERLRASFDVEQPERIQREQQRFDELIRGAMARPTLGWAPELPLARESFRRLVNMGADQKAILAKVESSLGRIVSAELCSPHGNTFKRARPLTNLSPAVVTNYSETDGLFQAIAQLENQPRAQRQIAVDAVLQAMLESRANGSWKMKSTEQIRLAIPAVETSIAEALLKVRRNTDDSPYHLLGRALALSSFGSGDAVYYVRNLAIAVWQLDGSFNAQMRRVHHNSPSQEIVDEVRKWGQSRAGKPAGEKALELAEALEKFIKPEALGEKLADFAFDVRDPELGWLLWALAKSTASPGATTVHLLGKAKLACGRYFDETQDGFERSRVMKLGTALDEIAYAVYPQLLETIGDSSDPTKIHLALVLTRSMIDALVGSGREESALEEIGGKLDVLLQQKSYDLRSLDLIGDVADASVSITRTIAKDSAELFKERAALFQQSFGEDVSWASDQLVRSDPALQLGEIAERLRNALPGLRRRFEGKSKPKNDPKSHAEAGLIRQFENFRIGAKGPESGVLLERVLVAETLEELLPESPGPRDLVCVQDFGQSNPPQAGAVISGVDLNPVAHISTWAEDEGVTALSFPDAVKLISKLKSELAPGEKIFVQTVEKGGERRCIVARESVARAQGLLSEGVVARTGLNADVQYFDIVPDDGGFRHHLRPLHRHRAGGADEPARLIALPKSWLTVRMPGTSSGKLMTFEELGAMGEAAVAMAGPKVATLARAAAEPVHELSDSVNHRGFLLPFGAVLRVAHRSGAFDAVRGMDLFGTKGKPVDIRETDFFSNPKLRRERLESAQKMVREKLRAHLESGREDALIDDVISRLGDATHFVARSSTQREDHVNLAGNGKFDSAVGRVCREDVIEALIEVMSSSLNPQAMDYVVDRGLDPRALEIAIGFMDVKQPKMSGALKVSADGAIATVQLTEGFGGGVSGTGAEVVKLDLRSGKIVSVDRPYSAERIEILNPEGPGTIHAAASRTGERLMSDDFALELSSLARRAHAMLRRFDAETPVDQRTFGLDMEFVVHQGGLELVQARPLGQS